MKKSLRVLLASPRGFCAGVARAIEIVDKALERFGPPIYVHHEIVHNPHILDDFRARGVIFVDHPDEVPTGGRMIVSAHGAPPATFERSRTRGLRLVDATCPLVTKVHREVSHYVRRGRRVILIGHRGHAEVIGTSGHAGEEFDLVETADDARTLPIRPGVDYAYATQTTLSVEDTADVVGVLRERIPGIAEPLRSDICYATTNRQAAVRTIAPRCDGMVIVGGSNSSNSRRLVDAARAAGCPRTWFVSRGADAPLAEFDALKTLGISSGASTPERLVNELVKALERRFTVDVETVSVTTEEEQYKLPSLSALHG